MVATLPTTSEVPGRTRRLPGYDVVRGVALIGVVVMNYHGYLNGATGPDPSWAERVFDPWSGPLSTRFAATFVMIAGVGVVLLTNRSRHSGDPVAVSADRWRLIRRGFVLFAAGYVIDWIWPGTILFYYGAMFVLAGLLFRVRTRWIVALGAASIVAAWGLQIWRIQREWHGHDTSWLFGDGRWSADVGDLRSPRKLVFDVFVNGTHPLLPWLGFFCAGILIGRAIPHLDRLRRPLLAAAGALVVVGYAVASAIDRLVDEPGSALEAQLAALGDTDPYSRMPLYVATAMGTAIIAVVAVAWLGDRYATSLPVDLLRRAGQLTLTLYVAHILVFDLLVDDLGMVSATGLDTALVFAVVFWVLAILAGAWWHRFVGRGPLEVLYRKFSA